MRHRILLPLWFASCLLASAGACGAQTDFDIRNKEGLTRNPPGVTLSLRTQDGRLTFHLFETIPIELAFSSSRPLTYSIELDETMNFAGWTQKIEVDPDSAVLLPFSGFYMHGVICCSSDRQYLSKQATVFHRELTDYIRFEKEGTYRVFFTTRRVFDSPRKYDDFGSSKILLTSNILTLTILADDPDWDTQHLAESLQKLHDIHVKANYRAVENAIEEIKSESGRYEAIANKLDRTELAQARRALNALDTEDAIRERIQMMDMLSKEQIRSEREYGGEMGLEQPLLESTTRPDLVVDFMQDRARDPDFGVDSDYTEWWARYTVVRDHKELFRPFRDETEHQKGLHSFPQYELAAKRDIVLQLESVLSSKRGPAKDTTALTIKIMRADIEYQTKDKKQTP
jgi:hypothetical protein